MKIALYPLSNFQIIRTNADTKSNWVILNYIIIYPMIALIFH